MSSQVARPLQRHGATFEVSFTEAFVSTPGSWRPRRPGTAAAASGCLRTQQLPAASALIAGRSSKSGGPLNGPTIDSIMMPRWPAAANTRGMGASTGFIHSSSWLFWKATSPMHAIVSSRPIRLRRTPILRSGSNTEIAPRPRPLRSRKRRLFWKAFDALFNKHDCAKARRYWSDRHIQHTAAAQCPLRSESGRNMSSREMTRCSISRPHLWRSRIRNPSHDHKIEIASLC